MNSLFTSSFGLLALIADPKVIEATETINKKDKIKLSWFMFNLENNNKNTKFITNDKKFNKLPQKCFNNDFD